jgi:hypothetical protein
MVYFDVFCTSMFVYRRESISMVDLFTFSRFVKFGCPMGIYCGSELGGYPLVSPNSLWQPLENSPEKRSISLPEGTQAMNMCRCVEAHMRSMVLEYLPTFTP